MVLGLMATSVGQTAWSIGDPTDEEQLYLELINRARANPSAEGALLAAETDPYTRGKYTDLPVNLSMMQNEFDAIPPQAPLAFSAALNASAASHATDMQSNDFQSHQGSNGSTIVGRAEAAGYTGWSSMGENIFNGVRNVWHGHASFEVDWGNGSGGMQTGRTHRVAIHDPGSREVGIAVAYGPDGDLDTASITQDFGTRSAYPSFVTGVVYYDLDGDGFYDPGEGIGGVAVAVSGAAYVATTSASGGYAIPTPNGGHTVIFTLQDGTSHAQAVTVSGGQNAKVDWSPPFTGTSLSGPSEVAVGVGAEFGLSETGGAVAYEVKEATLDTSPAMEGAENGTSADSGEGALTIEKSGSYDALRYSSGSFKKSGSRAFHLAHSNTSSPPQRVTLERLFVPASDGQLTFWSRLRWADEGQWAVVEISDDEGANWQRVWMQRGRFNVTEGSFTQKTIPLADYAGQHIKVRFSYLQSTGYQAIGTSHNYGWFFDDIEMVNAPEITASTTTEVSKDSPVFTYAASAEGTATFFARARTARNGLDWSGGLTVQATANDYGAWAGRMEAQGGLPAGSLSDRGGDYDGDGRRQAFEYALEAEGFRPDTAAGDPIMGVAIDGGFVVYDYRVDTSKADATVEVLASTDLENWFTADQPGRPGGFEDVLLGYEGGAVELRRARVPLGDVVYFRLRVTVTGG